VKVKAFVLGVIASLFAAVGLSMAPAASAAPPGGRIIRGIINGVGNGIGGKIIGDRLDKITHARPTVNVCGLFGQVDGYLPLPDWAFLIDQGCNVETVGVSQQDEQYLRVKYQKQDAAAVAKNQYHAAPAPAPSPAPSSTTAPVWVAPVPG
jgi:hypothetical protein